DAFGRALVVAAARGVHVVIAGIPALRCCVHPPGEPEFDRGRESVLGNGDHPPLRVVLRTATDRERIFAGWQPQLLAISSIDLRLKEEVGGEPLAAGRIDASEPVLDEER